MRAILATPPIPCRAPVGVFDAYGWCASSVLELRTPDAALVDGSVTADNPPRMVFVFRKELTFLPRELARLHIPALGLEDEWALAPYAIDDATDGLYEHKVPPAEALWLAADSVAGVFWGLHDWAHFHNHGPFHARAETELECDRAALTWLWLNREALGVSDARWEEARRDVEAVAAARFRDDGGELPKEALAGAPLQMGHASPVSTHS